VNIAPANLPDAPLESPRPLPRVFGRYKLFDYIGKGGMAEIYLARAETGLGAARLCVVKQIIPQFAEHPEFAAMLTHEAKLAARLSHANIVQVFDLGRESGHLFIAMEYVEGMDLNALLRRCSQTKTPLPVGYALRILSDTLKGLDYAHRAKDDEGKPLGIVHRDVSPSNVLISLEGEVKLCDFGIAHANDLVETKGPHMDEAIKGKAGYMSPEHARGEPLDARADVFAAGILLWELLAGRRLYRVEPGRPQLLEQARRAEVPPLPDKGLPKEAELKAIVHKALAQNRAERYASAGAMERDLEAYIAAAKLASSPLKLGEWIANRFGTATITQRRARERLVSDRPPPAPELAELDEGPPSSIPSPPTPSLRALQEALLTEPRLTPLPPAPQSKPPVPMIPAAAPSTSGAWGASPAASSSASGSYQSALPPPLPPPSYPLPPPLPGLPAMQHLPPIPSPPISVALGTVDLGPPSSTVLSGRRKGSRTALIVVALVLVVLAIAIGALVALRYGVPR
jgi:eukaryotic-like serine/threonine-protein kinase